MFSKIFTGLFIVTMAYCLYGYTSLQSSTEDQQISFAKKASLITTEKPSSLKPLKDLEKGKMKFLQFIYQLSELAFINNSDASLWLESKQYFPQIEQFKNHHLSLQYIASKGDTHLIFYEFKDAETANKGAMFLASFSEQGDMIDQLRFKAISFDGTLSVNMVDDAIIEVEYIDFFVKNHFKHSDNYIQKQDRQSKFGYRPVPEREVILEKQFIEYTDFEYYSFDNNKQFQQLSKNNTAYKNRTYPQAANRIISNEELLLMKSDELELMRNEIYASHGFIFTDASWSTHFSEMTWYTASQKNVTAMLSDVERINLEHITAITKKDYSFSNR